MMQTTEASGTPVQVVEQPVKVESIDDLIHAESARFSVNEFHMQKTIQCESHEDTTAVGDHGKAYGVAQWHEDSFNFWKNVAITKYHEPFQNLEYKNPEDQITLMAWMWANGHQSAWSCYHIEEIKDWQ